jgi:hypothetical protein
MKSIDERNRQFYNFLDETFNLKKCKTWDSVAKQITLEKVMKTYKYFASIFPLNVDYTNLIRTSDDKFRTLHYGDLEGSTIIDQIVRYSLYTDEIIVFHPLQNPSITNQKFNPIKNTKTWLADFLSALYFYIVIKKWVELGIVKLIVNPVQFELQEKAIKRATSTVESKHDIEIWSESTKNQMALSLTNTMGNKPIEWIYKVLIEMQQPKFNESDAQDMAARIKGAYTSHNPLYDKININTNGGSILTSKMGGSLEEVNFISQITQSSIYTSTPTCWSMLKSTQNDFWTKMAHAYSKINMSFLKNVDTTFVLNLRNEGRLTALRIALKEIFKDLDNIDPSSLSDFKMKELNDHLLDAIRSSDAEWNIIEKEAEQKRKFWAITSAASLGTPIVLHEVSIISMLVGVAAWMGNSIKNEKIKKEGFRQGNALSVYVDLKHKNEGFFSDIKSCLV